MAEASLAVLIGAGAIQAFIGLVGFIIGMQVMDDADGVLIIYVISQLLAIAGKEATIKVVAAFV